MPCDPPWPVPLAEPEPSASPPGPWPAPLRPAVVPVLSWLLDEAPGEDPGADSCGRESPDEGIDAEPAEPWPLEPDEGVFAELPSPERPEEPPEPEALPEDDGEEVGEGTDVDCWLAQPPIRNTDTAPAAATRTTTAIHRYSE
ncbi:hypothetical protein [Steroidobacter denitrificans]|uniref:hypothetical protein n=1 Tax=Steroidobacter denitrificans TaxID=465721 RepID=UPI001AEF5B4F|nr:hypothetical protein [Steroidobacter denitrificans]